MFMFFVLFSFSFFPFKQVKPFSLPEQVETQTLEHSSGWSFEHSDYAQDRCCNSGCIAQVSTAPPMKVAKVKTTTHVTSVYFEEDSSDINAIGIEKIKQFAESNSDKGEIAIVGYTDGCGTMSYNRSLATRRAESIKAEYKKYNIFASIHVSAAGEISKGHAAKARRVDITLKSNTIMYAPPPTIVADFYLIDSSGSMSSEEWEYWNRAIAFHRPPGSKVFVSTTACIRNKTRLDKINPAGGTEIWYSYWVILGKMKEGQTLIIMSDYESDHPLKPWERKALDDKVRAQGVKVKAMRTNL